MTYSSSQRRALIVKNDFSSFGNKVIEAGYANREQMQQAVADSRKSGRPLIEIIESMTGKQLTPDLHRQYKNQQLFELKILYGVECLDPEVNEAKTAQASNLIDTLIPVDACRRYRLIPLAKNDTQPPSVLVAMVDPDNLDAQDTLNRILRPKGFGLQRVVITQEDFQQILSKFLDEQVEKQKQIDLEKSVDVKSELENLDLQDAPDDMDADLGAAVQDAAAAPVIALVNKILVKGLQEKVSDIHIEPQEESLRIRFRKDGVLRQAFEPLPKQIVPAVTARFKILLLT